MAKVLLVEDNEMSLVLVQHHLAKAGHRVIAIDSAERAIEVLDERTPPDVVVLDLSLPGMDGRTLAKKIRSDDRTRDVRLIFLSARVDPERIAEALEVADAYLTKPFVASALLATIESVCTKDTQPEGW